MRRALRSYEYKSITSSGYYYYYYAHRFRFRVRKLPGSPRIVAAAERHMKFEWGILWVETHLLTNNIPEIRYACDLRQFEDVMGNTLVTFTLFLVIFPDGSR